jgi:diguanylate cyclase (GGDEF)-like protein/PAS domain S-box-containing protein
LFDSIPDGVVVVDRDGQIALANRNLAALTGYRRKELIGRSIETLVPPALRPGHRARRHEYYARGARRRQMGAPDHDFRVRRKDGSEFSADISLGPFGTGPAEQTIAVIRDITERRELEAELEHRALHDPLTELPNRALFFDRLRLALLNGRRDQHRVALVMLDLDGFKRVNDAYGHAAGDAVLTAYALRFRAALRAADTLARIGGDEFAWIMGRVRDREAAARSLRRFLRSLSSDFLIGAARLTVGITAGLAVFPDDGRHIDALMRAADSDLYVRKRIELELA